MEFSEEELEIARQAVENTLVEMRDARISVLRNNGLCIKERDGSPSSVIRMPIESCVEIGVRAIMEHRKENE